jgi:hypothetical protein
MSDELPREIHFDEVTVGDRVRYLDQEVVVREVTRNGGSVMVNHRGRPALQGMQRQRLTLLERPAQDAPVTCDQDDCDTQADVRFFFQDADGGALSEDWNRCWAHATVPLPALAPEGSIITLAAVRA